MNKKKGSYYRLTPPNPNKQGWEKALTTQSEGELFWDIETYKNENHECVPYLICVVGKHLGVSIELHWSG